MLNLNLLPASIKEEVKLKRLYRLLKKISFIILLLPFIYSGALWGAKTALIDSLNALEEHSLLLNRNSQGYNKKVRQINQQIKNIQEIEANFSFLSCPLKEIANSVPAGVSLTELAMDKNTQILKIKGQAAKRDDLLQFKDRLEKLNLVASVDLPLENLLKQKDVKFTLTVSLNKF